MESVELKRQDLIHTSSGKCHKYVPPLSFPDGNFRRTIFDPLPPPLVGEKQVKREETFITSTGVAHDNKWSQNPYKNELYKKAPGHWNQQIYVKDLREKLMHRPHRVTLTVRESEMRGKYRAEEGIAWDFADKEFHPGPQEFRRKDHEADGPTKLIVAGTRNEVIAGAPYYVRDKAILKELDPYLSITQKDHRSFTKNELNGYPKKDNATYWACEDYPKAWGHGPHENPLPKAAVPRAKLPMRDVADNHNLDKFQHPVDIKNLPKRMRPVPNKGLKSTNHADFIAPADEKLRDMFVCPVRNPIQVPNPVAAKIVLREPNLYERESDIVGSGLPAVVTGH